MNQHARVASPEVIEEFRTVYGHYGSTIRDTLDSALWEARRALQWLETEQRQYWRGQTRVASNKISETRINLERCEVAIRADDKRGCYVEKKAFEKAKARLRFCEEQVRIVQKWIRLIHRELEVFEGKLSQLSEFVDADVPRGVAALENMLTAIEKYTGTTTRLTPVDGDSKESKGAS